MLLNGPDGTFTDAWKTEEAQTNMEAIIDKAVADGTKIDAILAENDSMALGVAAALQGKNYGFPPLSGQDGDQANLNNVALGKQYVDVWKNANELGKAAGAAALELCKGTALADLTLPDGLSTRQSRRTPVSRRRTSRRRAGTRSSRSSSSRPRSPRRTCSWPIDGGRITKEDLCKGVDAADGAGRLQVAVTDR